MLATKPVSYSLNLSATQPPYATNKSVCLAMLLTKPVCYSTSSVPMPVSVFGIRGYTGQELWSVDDGPQVLTLLYLLVQKYISGYTGQELWSVHDGPQVLTLLEKSM